MYPVCELDHRLSYQPDMPKLLIRSSDTGGNRFLSIDEEVLTIGRSSNNDLCLPQLSVSSFHSIIIPEKSGMIIKDLHSTNGTWVNGERIEKQVLVHLDDITIGANTISYFETSTGNYRLSFPSSTAPEQVSDSETATKNVTQLPLPLRNNWVAMQKKFDYPVNAFGHRIAPDDTTAMLVWKREKIDEDGLVANSVSED